MVLDRLTVTNFRNLKNIDVHFSSGFNVIIGANGSGKTSLLESIFYLGHGRSFKSTINNRIVNYDADQFVIFSELLLDNTKTTLGLARDKKGEVQLKIDGQAVKKMSNLASLLPMQIIMPEGLCLLNGSPSERRSFLDWGLFHLNNDFKQLWKDFNLSLKQRNAMLGFANSYNDVAPWDKGFVKLTEKMTALRSSYSEILEQEIAQTISFFLPELELSSSFYQGFNNDLPFAEILKNNFESDKKMGYTLVGTQKSDLKFKAHNHPVSDILSRGQLKLLMCALRLAQGEHLMKSKDQSCLFLIDDFASELDPKKRALLMQRLRESKSQVFISAITEEQLSGINFNENDKFFQIIDGNLSEITPNLEKIIG